MYNNPRTYAEIPNWPYGQHRRVVCRFYVETDKRGRERVCRITRKPNGQWSKPKKTTYGQICAIVEGDNGKTYVLIFTEQYRQITVMQSNLQYMEESLCESDQDHYVRAMDVLLARQNIRCPVESSS